MKLCFFVLITATLCLSSFVTKAQYQLGVNFGTQISTIKGDDEDHNDPSGLKGIIHLGVTHRMPVTDVIAINTELNYIQKGGRYAYFTTFNTERTKTRVVLNYLEMPLLIQLGNQANDSSRIKAFLNVGTGIGVAIGKTQIRTNEELKNPEGFRRIIRKEVEQRLESSLLIGIGLRGKKNSVEFRYGSSLTSVLEDDSKNRYYSLTFCLLLPTEE
ncbi:MAG: porin family protein [Tunicatimonas sp.]